MEITKVETTINPLLYQKILIGSLLDNFIFFRNIKLNDPIIKTELTLTYQDLPYIISLGLNQKINVKLFLGLKLEEEPKNLDKFLKLFDPSLIIEPESTKLYWQASILTPEGNFPIQFMMPWIVSSIQGCKDFMTTETFKDILIEELDKYLLYQQGTQLGKLLID